jgi:hypothetical protein
VRRWLPGAVLVTVGALAVWALVAVLGDGGEGTADGANAAAEGPATSASAGSGTTTSAGSAGTSTSLATGTTATVPTTSAVGNAPTSTVTSAAAPTTAPATARRVPEGTWGGRGIRLVLGPNGGSVEYDCASGLIAQALVLDGDGSFRAEGTHAFQSGGPVQAGTASPGAQPARYTGSVTGSQMELTVVLPQAGRTLGPFSLRLGQQPLLDRCG